MKSDQKIALVTGANRGIGFETARELAERGVSVVIGTRDRRQGEEAASRLSRSGLLVRSVVLDVSKAVHHQEVLKYLQHEFGRLDILINNAGVLIEVESASADRMNRTSSTSMEVLRDTFEINFFAQVALTQALLPLIRRSSAGRIVNVSSILGSLTLHCDPTARIYNGKVFAYDASKTALNAFTVHLAHELLNTNIKVNSAHPGWVKTKMGGQLAPVELADGAKTSVRLALLPDDGPTGGFFYHDDPLPW
ncbi:MAG: SDR family oxidoreductase [Bdellovibrionales bacterium]